MANSKAEPLVREEFEQPDRYYPWRCGNDYCDNRAEYRFGWGTPSGEPVCSFACWLTVTKGK